MGMLHAYSSLYLSCLAQVNTALGWLTEEKRSSASDSEQ